MIHLNLKAALLAGCTLLSLSASARIDRSEKPPKALLVILQTRGSQREYLQHHKPGLLPEFQKDVEGVMQATVRDFSLNFSFCPVYFFIDTNSALIGQRHFAGVLLDDHLQPVTNPALQNGDTSFFVAYYGSKLPQNASAAGLRGFVGNSTNTYIEKTGDGATSLFPTLLVLDHRFDLLKLPRPRTARGYSARNARRSKLAYHSKRFEIDYVPMAASYDATIDRYYAKLRRRKEYTY